MIFYLKIWPEFYRDVKSGIKPFEIRKDDRPEGKYEIGDLLILQEFDPENNCYTKTNDTYREVTYTLREQPFVPEGYVCMGLKEAKQEIFEYCHHYMNAKSQKAKECMNPLIDPHCKGCPYCKF